MRVDLNYVLTAFFPYCNVLFFLFISSSLLFLPFLVPLAIDAAFGLAAAAPLLLSHVSSGTRYKTDGGQLNKKLT
jgi:hypothetical protein